MSEEVLCGIISVVFIILAAFLIPLILRLKRTLNAAENFIAVTQESLVPLLSELKTGIEKLNNITGGIEDSVKNVQHLTRAIGETGELIDGLNRFVKQTGLSFSIKTASLGVGIKTALHVLAKGIIKKASNKDDA